MQMLNENYEDFIKKLSSLTNVTAEQSFYDALSKAPETRKLYRQFTGALAASFSKKRTLIDPRNNINFWFKFMLELSGNKIGDDKNFEQKLRIILPKFISKDNKFGPFIDIMKFIEMINEKNLVKTPSLSEIYIVCEDSKFKVEEPENIEQINLGIDTDVFGLRPAIAKLIQLSAGKYVLEVSHAFKLYLEYKRSKNQVGDMYLWNKFKDKFLQPLLNTLAVYHREAPKDIRQAKHFIDIINMINK